MVMTWAALLFAVAGGISALVGGGEYLRSVNSAGIPRIVPASLSFGLAAAALASWCAGFPFRLLSLHWALAAAAFARPAARAGVPDGIRPVVEAVADAATLGALLACVGLVIYGIAFRDARSVRLAIAGAFVAWAVVLAVLSVPPGRAVDASASLTIVVAAILACRAAHLLQRFQS